MTRQNFIDLIDEKIKLIRTEKGYTQEKMADVIGISKKTLVQIEKGRASLGWTASVAVCIIFKDSEILGMTLGGETQDIILTLAFDGYDVKVDKTMGGRIWWTNIDKKGKLVLQQNIVSKHYRILDEKDRRICSSFDLNYIKGKMENEAK